MAKGRSAVNSALSLPMRDFAVSSPCVVKVGFLAPLSGPLKSWALPGLNGSTIWIERVNQAGGIKVGNRRYVLELVEYDTKYDADTALMGAKRLILEEGVKL